MNYILSFFVVLILSIGNFFPSASEEFPLIAIKIFSLMLSALGFIILNRKFSLKKGLILYFIFITIIFLISTFKSLDFNYAAEKYFSVSLTVIICFFFLEKLIKRTDFDDAIKYILRVGLLILILTLIYKAMFGFWEREVRFFLNGPIVFGWIMSMYSLLSLYLFKKYRGIKYLILSSIFFISIIWTGSKGPLLSYMIALFFYLLYSGKYYIKTIFFIFIILFIYLKDIILYYLDYTLSNTRFSAIIRLFRSDLSNQDSGSIAIRQDMLLEASNFAINNWALGIGLGNYQFQTIYGFIYPHNIHLEVFLECGFFVGTIYLTFIIFSFLRSSAIIKALIIMFFICGLFSGDITYLRFLLLICMVGISLKDIPVPLPQSNPKVSI